MKLNLVRLRSYRQRSAASVIGDFVVAQAAAQRQLWRRGEVQLEGHAPPSYNTNSMCNDSALERHFSDVTAIVDAVEHTAEDYVEQTVTSNYFGTYDDIRRRHEHTVLQLFSAIKRGTWTPVSIGGPR